jgi:hypothetical protein
MRQIASNIQLPNGHGIGAAQDGSFSIFLVRA